MTTIEAAITATPGVARRRGLGLAKITVAVALLWLAVILACSVAPQLIAPYDPLAQDPGAILSPPSAAHLLGTDDLGRDVLSRIIWGAQPAMIGVAIALGTSLLLGVTWGLVAGFFGGVADLIAMRLADVILAFPSIILAMAIATVFGASLPVTMFAVGLALSPAIARLMRAGVLTVRTQDYVTVTRLYGHSEAYRIVRHVLPNAFSPVLVQLTIFSGIALLSQTGLTFLGIGVVPPAPSWGASLAESYRYISSAPWTTIPPGLVVTLTVLALYRIGDAARDRFAA